MWGWIAALHTRNVNVLFLVVYYGMNSNYCCLEKTKQIMEEVTNTNEETAPTLLMSHLCLGDGLRRRHTIINDGRCDDILSCYRTLHDDSITYQHTADCRYCICFYKLYIGCVNRVCDITLIGDDNRITSYRHHRSCNNRLSMTLNEISNRKSIAHTPRERTIINFCRVYRRTTHCSFDSHHIIEQNIRES